MNSISGEHQEFLDWWDWKALQENMEYLDVMEQMAVMVKQVSLDSWEVEVHLEEVGIRELKEILAMEA